ncbi:hypothetical protein [Actinomadura sp. 9N215]
MTSNRRHAPIAPSPRMKEAGTPVERAVPEHRPRAGGEVRVA